MPTDRTATRPRSSPFPGSLRRAGLGWGLLVLLVGGLGGCHTPRRAPPAPPASSVPSVPTVPSVGEARVTLLHFSDYHAHAVPFFSEHQSGQGGIARALAYIKKVKATAPGVLVLSGGDVWNAGTPAWSDKYARDCTEWTWLGEHLSAMAFGNHDVDYGWDPFSRCVQRGGFPVLSGNLVGSDGKLLLTDGGKPYVVKQVGRAGAGPGLKIGIFALSGPDFATLVKPGNLPAGARFTDGIQAALRIVRALRETEHVDVVVSIGHQSREADFELARAVPGIDVILGSHSHYKGELERIAGTSTYFISPFQYLNYLSQVELVQRDGKLAAVTGKLVRIDGALGEDPEIAARVRRMQQDLEADPLYKDRFQVIGRAAVELSLDGIERGESVLGNFAMDVFRSAARAHLALSTASSFRASIPPGPIRMEDYLTALPYKNSLYTAQLSAAQVQALLDLVVTKRGSDGFGVTSGVRYVIAGGRATNITLVKNPGEAGDPDDRGDRAQYEPLAPGRTYTVATTNFLARTAAGYKEQLGAATDTGQIFNDLLIGHIKKNSPVSAALDGRVTVKDPAP